MNICIKTIDQVFLSFFLLITTMSSEKKEERIPLKKETKVTKFANESKEFLEFCRETLAVFPDDDIADEFLRYPDIYAKLIRLYTTPDGITSLDGIGTIPVFTPYVRVIKKLNKEKQLEVLIRVRRLIDAAHACC